MSHLRSDVIVQLVRLPLSEGTNSQDDDEYQPHATVHCVVPPDHIYIANDATFLATRLPLDNSTVYDVLTRKSDASNGDILRPEGGKTKRRKNL